MRDRSPSQLALVLPRPSSPPKIEMMSPELVSTLADLLLEALGVANVTANSQGGGDEPEDHA